MNVLSLTATFGAMVWIFQDGHLASSLDVTATGSIDTGRTSSVCTGRSDKGRKQSAPAAAIGSASASMSQPWPRPTSQKPISVPGAHATANARSTIPSYVPRNRVGASAAASADATGDRIISPTVRITTAITTTASALVGQRNVSAAPWRSIPRTSMARALRRPAQRATGYCTSPMRIGLMVNRNPHVAMA